MLKPLALTLTLLCSSMSFATPQPFLVGTWTGLPSATQPTTHLPSEGMYSGRLNDDGSLTVLSELHMPSPSWIVIAKGKNIAYTTNETENGDVSALAIHEDGQLSLINKVKSLGNEPTHATLSQDGRFLIVANYSVKPNHASISVLPIQANGALGEAIQNIKFDQGSHNIKERQDAGHAHSVTFSPDGKYLYVADLGADTIHTFAYQANKKQPLVAQPKLDLHFNLGSGPRHVAFSANGDYLYVTTEMSAQVVVFKKDKQQYKEIQNVALTDKQDQAHKSGAGIVFSPDGRFLYVGNRGESNEIVYFSVDQATGKLVFKNRYSSQGIEPRAFTFDQTGKFFFVTNVFSHQITEFHVDTATGELSPTHHALNFGMPTDIKFIH